MSTAAADRVRSWVVLAGLAALMCGPGGCSRPEPPGPAEPDALFVEETAAAVAEFRLVNGASGRRFLVETMIGGLGWIDHDGDGDFDLYLVNGHSEPLRATQRGRESNRLLRNDGGGRFVDVTDHAGVGDRGYGCGLAVGDYDNDGDSDLFVTNIGADTLYRNRGDGTFEDVTERVGVAGAGWTSSAAWLDYDQDGWLDLWVVGYLRYTPGVSRDCREGETYAYCHPRLFAGRPDALYRNRGDGTFEDVSRRAGIDRASATEGKGLGIVTADFDDDGRVDVYIANDLTPNFLWLNVGDGTFREAGQERGVALGSDARPQAGMGVDVGDVDGDGRSDLHVTNFSGELNALYLATGQGAFVESSRRASLGATLAPLGFGTLLVDVDLDGDADIVTLNGHIDDLVAEHERGSGAVYEQRPDLWLNDGAGRFTDGREVAGPWFARRVVGRGLAASDFDDDGDVDLAAMTIDGSVTLLRSRATTRGASVTVRLVGRNGNRDAYGAHLEATVGGRTRRYEHTSARSYMSACDPRIVIGLGAAPRLDRLSVVWPGGARQELGPLPAGARVSVVEGEPLSLERSR